MKSQKKQQVLEEDSNEDSLNYQELKDNSEEEEKVIGTIQPNHFTFADRNISKEKSPYRKFR